MEKLTLQDWLTWARTANACYASTVKLENAIADGKTKREYINSLEPGELWFAMSKLGLNEEVRAKFPSDRCECCYRDSYKSREFMRRLLRTL